MILPSYLAYITIRHYEGQLLCIRQWLHMEIKCVRRFISNLLIFFPVSHVNMEPNVFVCFMQARKNVLTVYSMGILSFILPALQKIAMISTTLDEAFIPETLVKRKVDTKVRRNDMSEIIFDYYLKDYNRWGQISTSIIRKLLNKAGKNRQFSNYK